MSTPTETEFLDENAQQLQAEALVAPATEPEQHDPRHCDQPGHHHGDKPEDGDLSPLCAGGGCVTKTPA